jgi:hypothetical protein
VEIIEHYVSDRFDFTARGVTRQQLRERLIAHGADTTTVDNILGFFERADTLRYSGMEAVSRGDEMHRDAASLIDELERQMQRRRT